MFINAEPRYVSHGFETFVPISRTEPLHQRLVEMTNNDVNAWSIFRPVAQFEDWDQHIDEYGNNENFQVGFPRPIAAFDRIDKTDRSIAFMENTSRKARQLPQLKSSTFQGQLRMHRLIKSSVRTTRTFRPHSKHMKNRLQA